MKTSGIFHAMGQSFRDVRSDSLLAIPHGRNGRYFNPGVPDQSFDYAAL